MKKLLRQEAKVAFAKHAQPVYFRIAKYVALGSFILLFRNTGYFWWVITGLVLSGFLLHGFYRYKTRGWTQSYGQGLWR